MIKKMLHSLIDAIPFMSSPVPEFVKREGWPNVSVPSTANKYSRKTASQNTGYEERVEKLTDDPIERLAYISFVIMGGVKGVLHVDPDFEIIDMKTLRKKQISGSWKGLGLDNANVWDVISDMECIFEIEVKERVFNELDEFNIRGFADIVRSELKKTKGTENKEADQESA